MKKDLLFLLLIVVFAITTATTTAQVPAESGIVVNENDTSGQFDEETPDSLFKELEGLYFEHLPLGGIQSWKEYLESYDYIRRLLCGCPMPIHAKSFAPRIIWNDSISKKRRYVKTQTKKKNNIKRKRK